MHSYAFVNIFQGTVHTGQHFTVPRVLHGLPCPVAESHPSVTYQSRACTKSIFQLQLLHNTDRWMVDMQRQLAEVSLLTDPYPFLKAQARLTSPSTAVLSRLLNSATQRPPAQHTSKQCGRGEEIY